MDTLLIIFFSCCLCAAGALVMLRHLRQRADSEPKGAAMGLSTAESGLGLDASLLLELIATLQETGLSLSASLMHLAEVDTAHSAVLKAVSQRLSTGLPWKDAWAWADATALDPAMVQLKDTLAVVTVAGAPSADILRAAAARARRTEFRRAEQSAAKLAVKLVVPLGVCSLPAFICLGVLPVLMSLIPTMLGR